MKTCLIGWLLLWLLALIADVSSNPVVCLRPGVNEIELRLHNNCGIDLKSIQLATEPERMPDGFALSAAPIQLDVAAKQTSENTLGLRIQVNETVQAGNYPLPLRFTDQAGHSWRVTLTAEVAPALPEKFDLCQNYPNPFNPTTQITYALISKAAQATRLVIYDVLGKQVRILTDEMQQAGIYSAFWDGKDAAKRQVPSGVYFYKLTSGQFTQVRKMLLLE